MRLDCHAVDAEFKVPFKQTAYRKALKSCEPSYESEGEIAQFLGFSSRGFAKIDFAFVENPLVAADFDQAARVARLLR